jgi:AcrR family transcriptional regulator
MGRGANLLPAMETATGGLRERKKQRTYHLVARVTVELVAERGLQAVRVEDICAKAEIGRSTFFRYFDSKESSFVAGVHQGRLDAVLTALAARPPEEGPFTAACNAFFAVARDWRHLRDILLLDTRIRAESSAVRGRASADYALWEASIAAALASRFPPGERDSYGPRLLAGVVLSAVRLASEVWLADGARHSPAKEYAEAFAAIRDVVGGNAGT